MQKAVRARGEAEGGLRHRRWLFAGEKGCVRTPFVDASRASCPSSSTPKPISMPELRASSTPTPALARCCRSPGGRRCAAGPMGLPVSSPSSCRSSFRPPAPRQFWAGSPRRSIRSSPLPYCAREPTNSDASGSRHRRFRTLKAIAKSIDKGELDLASLVHLPADEAHAVLTAVHGIGPWTGDIYLLACLGHADAWPAGDLALQEAAKLLLALETRPTTKEMGPLAERWRPWRAVAARLLWTYYRARKQREGILVAAAPPQVASAPPKKQRRA